MERLLKEIEMNEDIKNSTYIETVLSYIQGTFDFAINEQFVIGVNDESKSIKELGEYIMNRAKGIKSDKQSILMVADATEWSWIDDYFVKTFELLFTKKHQDKLKKKFYETFKKKEQKNKNKNNIY